MSYIEIIMLSLALSADAFTVSFSYGLLPLEKPSKECLMLGIFTGFFQGLMSVIGYYLTLLALDYISPYSKYVVFGIFTILGIKFILESLYGNKSEKKLCISVFCLFMIGLATSIDAFTGGVSLKLCGNGILKPAFLIALVTFVNSIIGFNTGKNLKHINVKFMSVLAGMILVLLGLNALW